ncbi:hypothetical protein BCR34DRAFT_186182 [Clohesyomyces aquaticus]|uniref:Uncharacterized protein n=1 Tax=Clohesyomyces aquaticus TaxID=1231657 RepID=A0A1Y1YDG5_9PLEO|nr:hypothetical protein BCR34DRAFT_186182 [Clohesyomyces aquaticus]
MPCTMEPSSTREPTVLQRAATLFSHDRYLMRALISSVPRAPRPRWTFEAWSNSANQSIEMASNVGLPNRYQKRGIVRPLPPGLACKGHQEVFSAVLPSVLSVSAMPTLRSPCRPRTAQYQIRPGVHPAANRSSNDDVDVPCCTGTTQPLRTS